MGFCILDQSPNVVYLFEEGINLLIFSNPNDDITNKIQLICPTNHYSDNFYDETVKTLMIYNKNGFF